MLQNAYSKSLLAKIGADKAENDRNFAENLPTIGNYPTVQKLHASPLRSAPPTAARRRSPSTHAADWTV